MQRAAETRLFTCGKSSTKENVEEFFGGNVRLEVSVEVSVVSVATLGGLLGRVGGCRLFSVLIVLLPLLRIAQHCVCITYS